MPAWRQRPHDSDTLVRIGRGAVMRRRGARRDQATRSDPTCSAHSGHLSDWTSPQCSFPEAVIQNIVQYAVAAKGPLGVPATGLGRRSASPETASCAKGRPGSGAKYCPRDTLGVAGTSIDRTLTWAPGRGRPRGSRHSTDRHRRSSRGQPYRFRHRRRGSRCALSPKGRRPKRS